MGSGSPISPHPVPPSPLPNLSRAPNAALLTVRVASRAAARAWWFQALPASVPALSKQSTQGCEGRHARLPNTPHQSQPVFSSSPPTMLPIPRAQLPELLPFPVGYQFHLLHGCSSDPQVSPSSAYLTLLGSSEAKQGYLLLRCPPTVVNGKLCAALEAF